MPPSTYPTLSSTLPSKPYILSIHPSPSSPHLILRHPSPNLTLVDNQTLQAVDEFRGGHDERNGNGNVMAVSAEPGGGLWSGGRDAGVVRWDERGRRAAVRIKAFVRKPLPVLALTASEGDHLVIAGTELVSSEAHIIFWDTRNPSQPLYTHSSTHSDDITHLSLLPPTSSFLPPASGAAGPTPERLLLSASTDGLVALSDVHEADEDEAGLCAENFGESLADAGWYVRDSRGKGKGKGKGMAGMELRVWGRSDMDALGVWEVGRGEGESEWELELANLQAHPTDTFKYRSFPHPTYGQGPLITRTAAEERAEKDASKITSDYLIGAVPSLGTSEGGMPMAAVGTNDGDIILLHHSSASKANSYTPSGYFLTPPTPTSGHKDVVRAIYHDEANAALYTGSEDGVLSGWSLSSLSSRLKVGDRELDDVDEEDEKREEDEDDEEEESEIETDDEDDEDGMDVDESEEREEGPKNGPIIGLADRRERKKERTKPY